MTSKEALENIKNNYPLVHPSMHKVISESYAVLEKVVERDTPMIPIKLKWKYNGQNYYYVCPKCEEMVARTDEVFCQDCGQRLDWSE